MRPSFDYQELEDQLAKLRDREADVPGAVEEVREYFETITGERFRVSGTANTFTTPDNQIGNYIKPYFMPHREVTIKQVFPEGVAVQMAPIWKGMPNEMPILLWDSIDPFPDDADFV
jgi:hypothetical protein